MHWLERLLTHRLIFVMGKGGVGKTTVSILLSTAASRMGKKVLLAELSDSDAIGRYFNQDVLPETAIQLSDRLWGARINPKDELEAYTHAHVNPGFIANRITRSRLFDYLFAATPGLKEVMTLGRIWRWEKATNGNSSPVYDHIIVDAPATGHGLSLLRLPVQLIHMIRVGPIVSQIQALQEVLQDHDKTCLALVTLPEELPVNEAVEFYAEASTTLNIPVETAFINCVWPDIYTDKEIAQLNEISVSGRRDDSTAALEILADTAMRHVHRRILQQKYIDQLKAHIQCPLVEVPFYFTNDLSLTDIRSISTSFMPASLKPSG